MPPEEEEEPAAASRGEGAPRRRRESLWRPGSRAAAAGQKPAQNPFADRTAAPARRRSSPTRSRSRFRRRCRPAPASPTSSSATPRTRWISGSSIWPAPVRVQFTGKGSADIAPNDTGDVTGVASYDQGEWSVIFKRPLRVRRRARRSRRESSCRRLLGLGRVLARARQPARSHALVLALRRARSGPVGRLARWSGRRFILVIELVVIGWVRHGVRAPVASTAATGARPAAVTSV